jgi:hypothetical protein
MNGTTGHPMQGVRVPLGGRDTPAYSEGIPNGTRPEREWDNERDTSGRDTLHAHERDNIGATCESGMSRTSRRPLRAAHPIIGESLRGAPTRVPAPARLASWVTSPARIRPRVAASSSGGPQAGRLHLRDLWWRRRQLRRPRRALVAWWCTAGPSELPCSAFVMQQRPRRWDEAGGGWLT